jgi:quinol monooxygenase YgiN
VIVTATRITVQPDKRTELYQTIGGLVEHVNGTKGCLTFRHYIDASDENSYLLMGEWATDSDLNDFLRSNDFAVLRGAIRLLSIRSIDYRAMVTSRSRRP